MENYVRVELLQMVQGTSVKTATKKTFVHAIKTDFCTKICPTNALFRDKNMFTLGKVHIIMNK